MAKYSVEELDAGQLDMMWQFLQLGQIKPSSSDVECMIKNVDAVRQMLIQKTGGNRKNAPPYYINANDMGTHINLIVIAALSLRISGVLDTLLKQMRENEAQ